jgi:RimJ/RimL family protein N-acetyltransferase
MISTPGQRGQIVAKPIPAHRLTLVPLAVAHADEMATVLADPGLYRFTGGSPPTRAELHARYERWIAGSPDPAVSWCNWVIELRDPRCLAGTVQATISAGDEPEAEVAWVVGTPWQGQGIATESAKALIAWLGTQSVKSVIAHIHPSHQASAAVAASAGLAPTGELQEGEMRFQRGLSESRRSRTLRVMRSTIGSWPSRP